MSAELVDELPDGVVVLDAEGTITAVNRAVSRITGYPSQRLVGRPWLEALAPRDGDGKRLLTESWPRGAHLRAVRATPEQEVFIRPASGPDRPALVTCSYRRHPDGSLAGAVLVLRDGARRRNVDAAGATVVSTVSHELRSPLTSVKGYTSLLLNRWDRIADDDKKMMLEQINHDADRVTRLITELLDISRLASGRLVLRRQMVDLAALVAQVVDKVRLEYPDLTADLSFPPDLPRVYADPDKVVQVVTNLVENACKYASPTGLRIGATTDPDMVTVSVTDRGEGIPPEDIDRVFTRFFRRSEGRPTGSGLGLWISRGLVEAHGGELAVSSTPGQGSTFYFCLPLHAFEDAHPQS